MTKQDNIHFEILEDGTISVTTDGISGTNHLSADKLLAQLGELMGGAVSIKKRSRLAVGASSCLTNALANHAHDGHTH
jgi:hypothetical protein